MYFRLIVLTIVSVEYKFKVSFCLIQRWLFQCAYRQYHQLWW